MTARKTQALAVGVLLVVGGALWLARDEPAAARRVDVTASIERANVTEPFKMDAPVQSSMEAPVDIRIEGAGNGTARVTLTFHRAATGVFVQAYGVLGARVLDDPKPIEGLAVEAGQVEVFQSAFEPAEEGGGAFAVYVQGLFDGQLAMGRAASVKLRSTRSPVSGAQDAAATPGNVVVDSEGRRVHVMPSGR